MEHQDQDSSNTQATKSKRPDNLLGSRLDVPAALEKVRSGQAGSPAVWPKVGLGLLCLFIAFVVGFFVLNGVLDGQYAGKIEPGVSISGIYVGQMSREEAKASVQKQLEGFAQKPVKLEFQDKTWNPPLEQLGVSINLESSLDKAMAVGRNGDFLKDLRLFKLMSSEIVNLPIEVQMDEAKLNGYLSDISDRIRKDTVEANVTLDAEGKLVVTEGKEGFNVDFEATNAAVSRSLQSLIATDENLLQVHSVAPVITNQEIEELKTSLTPLLSGPVTLGFKDKNWTFDRKQIAAQIKINRNTDKQQPRHLSYTLNTTYFEKYVADLSKTLNQEPQDAEVGVQDGRVVFTKPSQNGQFLSVGRTMDNLNQALAATDPEKRKTSLWVDVKEPKLSSANPEKLGNFEVIGEGVSAFSGSASDRATNIKVGAKYLNATIVEPRSTFSFLDAVGEISLKRGYAKGYAIIADQTVPDVGGGICQVATTMFRAAFFAGLPITERHPHAYRVSWYEEMGEPVGFDAAVYQPGVDLKFENPTDYYMLVTAFVDGGKLYVRILGNKTPGQKVELVSGGINNVTNSPPDRTEVDPELAPGQKKQVDFARKGLTTTITRIVKVNGEEVRRTTYPTRFQAWPNIFKVGPGTKQDASKTPDPTKEPGPTNAPPKTNPPATTQPPAPKPTTPPPPAATQPPAPKPTTPPPPAATQPPAPKPTTKP